jgi:hypothetical protein
LSITSPAIVITAGSVALEFMRDKLRADFDKKTMPEKVKSIQDGTSGYSFVDIAWAVLKTKFGNDKPQSSINIPRLPDSTVDTVPQLDNDAANFGVPAYLQRNNKSGNDKPQSSINIPRLPDSTVDTVPQLDNDAANCEFERNNEVGRQTVIN